MQERSTRVSEVKQLFDTMLQEPAFLIYQQQRLIAEAKRKIQVIELYRSSSVAMLDDGIKKKECCKRAIINAKNEIVLRENYIEYIKSLEEDPSIVGDSVDYIIDPLSYYMERIYLSENVIENPLPIANVDVEAAD